MAKGINKVILIGSAGNDPEVRYMPSGAAVANVSLATNESWMDKQTGQKQERVEWHRVAFMDRGNFRLGQIAGDFIKKGTKVYVEGSLRTREWEKDGIKRYTTEIIASEMQLLDARSDDGAQGGNQQQGGYGQNQQRPQQQNNQQAQPQSYGSWGNQPNNGYASAQGGAQQGGFNQPQSQGQAAPQQRQQQRPMSQQASPQQSQPQGQPQAGAPNFDDFDDDIPF